LPKKIPSLGYFLKPSISMPQPFTQNHRNRSYKGHNLQGENFRNADIRSVDFSNANLTGADFTNAKAGLSKRWTIAYLLGAGLVSILGGGIVGYFGNWCALYFNDNYVLEFSRFPGFAVLIVELVSMGLIAWRGPTISTVGIIFTTGAAAGTVTIAVASLFAGASVARTVAIAVAVAVAGAGAAALTSVISIIFAITAITTSSLVELIAIAIAAATAAAIAKAGSGAVTKAVIDPEALGIALSLIAAAFYLKWKALKLHPNFVILQQSASFIAATGGTRFCHANLTEAIFTQADLQSCDFRGAILQRTRWQQAILNTARLGNSILSNAVVRSLLITGEGCQKNYAECNLTGANLADAELEQADFTGAQLAGATFERANLNHTNLSKVQALGTNFQAAQLTGACLEAWNIDSLTQLEGIVCDYVYLLHFQQERRPGHGKFAPGDFTQLFQIVIDTIELIFHDDFNLKALENSLKTIQSQYPDQTLEIKRIDKKAEGLIVVEVKVDAIDKQAIYTELTETYDRALLQLQAQHQAKLIETQEELLTVYRRISSPPLRSLPGKVVVLNLGDGTLSSGFSVTVQIGSEGAPPSAVFRASLPPAPTLFNAYREWRMSYQKSLSTGSSRLDIPDTQVTNISWQAFHQNCRSASHELHNQINAWLNHVSFRSIRERLSEHLDRSEPIRVILQTDDADVKRLPLHLWDFFERYPTAEMAMSSSSYERVSGCASKVETLQVLAILGDRTGIDIQRDQNLLQTSLPDAEIHFLDAPSRQQLTDHLWSEPWNILFFAGHSSSQSEDKTVSHSNQNRGEICINASEKLTIDELRNALQGAIRKGLKLAIFNSCDGLGLAADLAQLNIPQVIVMREPVPDVVAQEFLKNFLLSFAKGTPLYQSVREAREKLQGLEDRFPCAGWLPVICQNPAETPLSYQRRDDKTIRTYFQP
jgi:uncharacterized protein YjbI with pentapeptide repeats